MNALPENTTFIIDTHGNRKSIILDYDYYKDLEDSIDLLNAQNEAEGFYIYKEFVEKLKSEGRI